VGSKFEVAIIVIERERSALAAIEKRLDRQIHKAPPDSDEARGAKQARDEVQGRMGALGHALKHLRS
jgi:hypothetical protein